MTWQVLEGDCLDVLATLDDGAVQTCVTSPPYWGLRDYGSDGQLGLEPTPEQYVANLVAVFREVRRVLRDDGTLWLNLGDSYARNGGEQDGGNRELLHLNGKQRRMLSVPAGSGLKPKDLVGIPWMVAFALRADGWYLRSDIIWAKPNPMPESVTDRPTKAHEYLFLLSKSPRYFYDTYAIAEPANFPGGPGNVRPSLGDGSDFFRTRANVDKIGPRETRNKRTVWTVNPRPFPGAHFATFPPKLIEPCVLAGSPYLATVLDPFSGAGTTGLVALRHDRSYIGIELNPEYVEMSRNRIRDDAPLLNVGIETAPPPPLQSTEEARR